MKSIGLTIKHRRKQLGLTQDELATKCGYTSKSTIAKIENGTNELTQSKITKIANALDMDPVELFKSSHQPEENIFADNLSKLLIRTGTKNSELASAINVSPSAVSHWLNGSAIPRAKIVKSVADFFNVDMSVLWHEDIRDAVLIENNDSLSSTLVTNLNMQMTKMGYTQQDIAERIGCSQASVSNWCSGRKLPRLEKIDSLCKILDCTRDELIADLGVSSLKDNSQCNEDEVLNIDYFIDSVNVAGKIITYKGLELTEEQRRVLKALISAFENIINPK